MMAFDLSPLYRTTVGFDRFADLFDAATNSDSNGFPPYNIEITGENKYRVTLAVAGFAQSELSIQQQDNELVVSGTGDESSDGRAFLYRGIAGRAFERRFQLADHVKVTEATLNNGLLQINLMREIPEALRPRKIEIGRPSSPATLHHKKTAA